MAIFSAWRFPISGSDRSNLGSGSDDRNHLRHDPNQQQISVRENM
jgi:hypothetical protein